MDVRFAVVGIEHPHVFELVDGLIAAGASLAAHAGEAGGLFDAFEGWQADSPRREQGQILDDETIDFVVLAGVPNERAGVAVRALEAGRSVLSDKPGVTSLDQLAAVKEAEANNPGRWWVLFSERFGNRAVSAAVELVATGAVGRVVDVVGLGPHTLAAGSRPDWFWDPVTSGGILGDIATHQIDQFCTIVDPDGEHDIVVSGASVGNVSCSTHPAMQDIGRLTLVGGGATGTHRVDYLTPTGLGTWGDCRLMICGTEATLEVRTNIDLGGPEGGEHLLRVDADGTERVDVSDVEIDWAERLLADLANGTDTLMSPDHVHRVSRLAVEAQAQATPWPN